MLIINIIESENCKTTKKLLRLIPFLLLRLKVDFITLTGEKDERNSDGYIAESIPAIVAIATNRSIILIMNHASLLQKKLIMMNTQKMKNMGIL